MKKIIAILVLTVVTASASGGCAGQKYRLNLDGYGLEAKKKEYSVGEEVRVTYRLIGTDTDYWFTLDCDDVKLKQDYTNAEGYILTFTMPEHDVTLKKHSRNSMTAESWNRP